MSRLLSAIKLDVTIQLRTQLYTIGIIASLAMAVALAQLSRPEQLSAFVPTLMLLVVGGSTLLYVAGLIIFEKDEGTLHAIIVSPLRPAEYLWAKIITLTTLATFEAMIMVGGAMLLMSFSAALTMPNIPLLLLGIISLGILYTLIGILLIVRYDKITDFLIPATGVVTVLELPFLYFLGWVEHPALLLIPTSAPTLIMQGAYIELPPWQWGYALGYTALLLIGLSVWAGRSFNHHVVRKVG